MKIAVVCASGIGDALIFHSASHALSKKGWEATTFTNHLAGFGRWLSQNARIEPQPPLDAILETLGGYDVIFLQHDNTPKARKIQTLPLPVYSFYGVHLAEKHGPFQPDRDFAASREKSMVDNLDAACQRFFGVKARDAGFAPPGGLIHRRHLRRIAIHPTASTEEKIWPREKFLIVAAWLRREEYDPVFVVSPNEQPQWDSPLFPTLEDLASFLYESGGFLGNDSAPAHLASLLRIPHLVIAGDGLQMPLWRTGWGAGSWIAPPKWAMRFKGLRKKWKLFTSESAVIKKLNNSVLRN